MFLGISYEGWVVGTLVVVAFLLGRYTKKK